VAPTVELIIIFWNIFYFYDLADCFVDHKFSLNVDLVHNILSNLNVKQTYKWTEAYTCRENITLFSAEVIN